MLGATQKIQTGAEPARSTPKSAEVFLFENGDSALRVVCISDTEGRHEDLEIPDGDILIHAGDFTNWGELAEVQKFDAWLGELPHKHKIVIAGNHDFLMQKAGQKAPQYLTNATYLQEDSVEVEGLKIYGSPYTPRCGEFAFQMKFPGMIKNTWDRIPDDTDILVTHGPPKGILDDNGKGKSCGDSYLRERVGQVKPRLHVFGHVHEGYGMTQVDGTLFVNAAALGPDKTASQPAFVFAVPARGLPIESVEIS